MTIFTENINTRVGNIETLQRELSSNVNKTTSYQDDMGQKILIDVVQLHQKKKQTCLIKTSYHIPKRRCSTQARKYKPILHCTEPLQRNDIITICLNMSDEHNY